MKNKILLFMMVLAVSIMGCKKDKTTEEQIPEGQLSKVVFKQNEGYFDFIRALPNGNILAIGTTYDSIKLGSTTYYADQRDIVFAIFDKSGNVLKSRILSLPKSQSFIDADVASDGSVYLAFSFIETINLGFGNLVSNGSNDVCLARFNSNLETINAYSYGTVDYDYGCSISIADGNQLIVVDGLNKAFDLHGVTVPIADNRSTLVVMKFNSTLSSSSFKEFSGNADTYLNPTEVVVDNNYNIYMTGQFSGKVYFGDEPKYGTGDFQTFLVKLNSSLETQWDLTSSGSSGGSTGEQLALDENQNLYLIARIEGMVDWLGDSYNFGTDGNIIQKINPNGDEVWTKEIKGVSSYSYGNLSVSNERVAFSIGKSTGDLVIERGGPPFSELVVLDYFGNIQWRKNCQTVGSGFPYIYISGCGIDSDKRIWVFGEISGNFDFNNNGSNIPEANFNEMSLKSFILKY